MTRFFIGLLLGILIGIGGTTAFLISAAGGDYFVSASPRVRELETSLKNSDQDREWLRRRLGEADEAMARLESRFVALSNRFDAIVDGAGGAATAGKKSTDSTAGAPGATSAAPTPRAGATPGAHPESAGGDGA